MIIQAVQGVSGVLSDPKPEALVIDLNALDPDTVKMRVLWWTNDSRQHQMLASYDRVLSAIVEAFHRAREKQERAA